MLASVFSVKVEVGHLQGERGRMGPGQKFEEREGVKKPSWKGRRGNSMESLGILKSRFNLVIMNL